MPINAQGFKIVASEAYVKWMNEPATQTVLNTLIAEMLAAAKPGSPIKHQDPTADPAAASSSPFLAPATNKVAPNPPSPKRAKAPTPPGASGGGGAGGSVKEDYSPVHLSTRFLGVDEVDMAHQQRSSSPGGASPISPNAALAARHIVVDPHIPLGPHERSVSPVEQEAAFMSSQISPPPPASYQLPHHHSASSLNASLSLADGAVASKEDIPVFFNPNGRCNNNGPPPEELDALQAAFNNAAKKKKGSVEEATQLTKAQFLPVCTECFKLPGFLRDLVFRRVVGSADATTVSYGQCRRFYESNMAPVTINRRLFDILREDHSRGYLALEDLQAAVKCLVETHPGLSFLTQSDFSAFYCGTVAYRILYNLERKQSQRVLWTDFDRSDLPDVMRSLDGMADINGELRYFSYEHFYVLYCRFWELDTDKDHLIGLADLQRYNQGELSNAVLERVVRGCGKKLISEVPNKMVFEDFIYFCLSEEDKNSAPAIYYWFKVLDLDGDGYLSGYEIHHFFAEQEARLSEYSAEPLKFEDVLCQMTDLIGADKAALHPQGFTLADFKACERPGNYFNMIFNAVKFYGFETRDPFGEHAAKAMPEKTDWDRFARIEYDRMANEAGA